MAYAVADVAKSPNDIFLSGGELYIAPYSDASTTLETGTTPTYNYLGYNSKDAGGELTDTPNTNKKEVFVTGVEDAVKSRTTFKRDVKFKCTLSQLNEHTLKVALGLNPTTDLATAGTILGGKGQDSPYYHLKYVVDSPQAGEKTATIYMCKARVESAVTMKFSDTNETGIEVTFTLEPVPAGNTTIKVGTQALAGYRYAIVLS